jgi:protein ImuA
MLPATVAPETLHPSLWRGGQLARGAARCVDTGYPELTAELPGGGWPLGSLTDLLTQQAGIGEMRLLQPVFRAAGKRPVALISPPHIPNALAFAYWGVPTDAFMVLRPRHTADALWAAEQTLRAGTCSAVIVWQKSIRPESLRRLHVAAQGSETLFFMVRPHLAAQDSSPAPLRLGLKANAHGILIDFVKRRGPQRVEPLLLNLRPSPVLAGRRSVTPAVVPEISPARRRETAKVLVLHE